MVFREHSAFTARTKSNAYVLCANKRNLQFHFRWYACTFGWALKRQYYKTVVEYKSSLFTAPINTVMNLKSPLNDCEVS